MSETAAVRPAPTPDTGWSYATKPTRWTLFLRTFLPWQLWRFVWINAKMIRIIGRAHKAADAAGTGRSS